MRELEKKKYKLIMFDIDGVLNAHGGNIQKESKDAILLLRENNIQVGFASGKHAWYIQGGLVWSGLLEKNTLIVAENGGVVYDPQTRKTLVSDKHLDDVRLLRNIFYNLYKKKQGYLNFAGLTVWEEPKESLFCLYPEHTKDVSRLSELLKEIIDVNELKLYLVENPDSVDILQEGVNKATGIKQVCKWIGIEMTNVIGVGDSYNDKEMLEEVGFSVTLANGKQEIKELVKSKGENGFISSFECGKGVFEFVKFLVNR